jgi:multiple sugar transport system substrate-binding protein
VPESWSELLEMARRGLVAAPGVAIDSLMHFYMLCSGLGEDAFARDDIVAPAEIGIPALEMLRTFLHLLSPDCATRNPIAIWEGLCADDSVALCPFAFGYSNYGRPRYAKHRLEFCGLVKVDGHARCRSTLGGAGLAVSARCRHVDTAVEYCRFVAGSESQTGLYFESGGQPGRRSAWLDAEVNRASANFFLNTLSTLDEAYLRPRWNGYLNFQDAAAPILHDYLWRGGSAAQVLRRLNELLATNRPLAPRSGQR